MRKPKTVVLAVVNDIHAGSTTAVCPPEVPLDDGGHYRASKAQRWLADCWDDYWGRVAGLRKSEGAELYVIINGDAVDGDHHDTSQIVGRNPNTQFHILAELLKRPLALSPDRIFVVRGTAAHVGESGCAEEGIAGGLRRDKRPVVGDAETGTDSWWHPVLDVHNTRIDIAHQGRAGHREHTSAGAMSLYAHDILLGHVKNGERHPDLCLRAHYHRFADSYDACPVRVVTNGAWQLKTGFVHQKLADSLAHIGGLMVTVRPNCAPDQYALDKVHYKASRGTVWRA